MCVSVCVHVSLRVCERENLLAEEQENGASVEKYFCLALVREPLYEKYM